MILRVGLTCLLGVAFVFWESFWLEWGTEPGKAWYRIPTAVSVGFVLTIPFVIGALVLLWRHA